MAQTMIASLYDYGMWVNERLFRAAEHLTPEQFVQKFAHGFESVRGTFVHILGAELLWFARWQGQSPKTWPVEPTTLAQIRARWEQLARERRAYCETLTDSQLDERVRYTSIRGQTYELPRWQLMLQCANHSTHHRAEIAAMLTELGREPETTDILAVCRREFILSLNWPKSVSSELRKIA